MVGVRLDQDGPYRMIELYDEQENSRVVVCPERGAIATSFVSRGVELFYLDRATFMDQSANIRGGNPILFPISGQLEGGRYELEGQTYSMKNHGVARTSSWEVVDYGVNPEGQPYLTVRLEANRETLDAYPFDFELLFTYKLIKGALLLEQRYHNRSERSMPMYPGFHPYFAATDKQLAYETDATAYYDYNDGATKAFNGALDLEGLQEAVVLMDVKEPRISFGLPGTDRVVKLRYSELFRYVVLWTSEGKDFICVEPWMARNGELHRGDELVWVKPGDTLVAELHMDTESKGMGS